MITAKPDRTDDADLKARVVAWHNRSLLTRRIDVAQVTGLGIVALPFALVEPVPPGASFDAPEGARNRFALLGARIRRLMTGWRSLPPKRRGASSQPLFSEDFIAPLTPRMVARFARRHGEMQRPRDAAWPLRRVKPVDNDSPITVRYLHTAAIESGGLRLRVLIGGGRHPRIIGPRLWSRKRLSGVVAASCVFVIFGSAVSMLWPSWAADDQGPTLASATPTARQDTNEPGAVRVSATASAPASASDSAFSSASASALAPTPTPASVIDAAAESTSRSAAAAPPVRAESPTVLAAPQADTPASSGVAKAKPSAAVDDPAHRSTTAETAAIAAAAAADQTLFALAAEPTRSRVSSMLRLSLLDLPVEPQKGGAHAELMQAGAGWRVVIWPYPSRQAALSAQDSLRRRGVKVELIAF